MDEVAFQDWPGPPVDMNAGNNPWMPAYGFQTPSALLEKEDFIGNPGKWFLVLINALKRETMFFIILLLRNDYVI